MTSKMVNRLGTFVYQSAAYNLPCISRHSAMQMFPKSMLQEGGGDAQLTWRAETIAQLRVMLGTMLTDWDSRCAGLTRLLQTASERVARVVATLKPPCEISWVQLTDGRNRLYVNMEYCLFDCDGEMHPPKDSERREIAMTQEQVQEMRIAVMADVLALSTAGQQLAPGFWRQLGQEEKALEVETMLAQPQERRQAARLARQQARQQLQLTLAQPTYTIDCILDQHSSTGRARNWYLVRWEGYDLTWEAWRIHGEVGSPLETWEPEANVLQRHRRINRGCSGRNNAVARQGTAEGAIYWGAATEGMPP